MNKSLITTAIAVMALFGCKSAPDTSKMNVVLDLRREIKAECVGQYKAAFAECKAQTVKEEGNIDYALFQSVDDSTVLFIHEVWKDSEALAKHGETAHLKHFVEITAPMTVSKDNQKFYAVPAE